jgi:hypothetical protein
VHWDLTPVEIAGLPPVAFDSTGARTVNGFVGGGQFGASYQIGRLVIGGAGVEYLFSPNWSAKTEYDYIDFGARHYQLFSPTTAGLAIPVTYDVDIMQRIHLVKLGLNYRLTFGGSVVAKY